MDGSLLERTTLRQNSFLSTFTSNANPSNTSDASLQAPGNSGSALKPLHPFLVPDMRGTPSLISMDVDKVCVWVMAADPSQLHLLRRPGARIWIGTLDRREQFGVPVLTLLSIVASPLVRDDTVCGPARTHLWLPVLTCTRILRL